MSVYAARSNGNENLVRFHAEKSTITDVYSTISDDTRLNTHKSIFQSVYTRVWDFVTAWVTKITVVDEKRYSSF